MGGFDSKVILIDANGHLLGRLAAIIAKTLLEGHRVTVVRCEDLSISGNFFRAKLKYLSFLRKRCNVNPARGPFHHRSPAKILKRTVRGMLPHKTTRGRMAMKRLRSFEGIPPPFDHRRRQVVPGAMRIMCLRVGREYCKLGRLAHEVGWKYQSVIQTLESKRKCKAYLDIQKRLCKKRISRRADKVIVKNVAPRHAALIKKYAFNLVN